MSALLIPIHSCENCALLKLWLVIVLKSSQVVIIMDEPSVGKARGLLMSIDHHRHMKYLDVIIFNRLFMPFNMLGTSLCSSVYFYN